MKPPNRIFAHSATDIFPAISGLLHFAFVVGLYYLFPSLPWWALICLGFTYSVSVSWNINGVAHAFLHNPFFRAPALNRLFSVLESWTMGYSQTFYDRVHTEHHMGNGDRPDEEGKTIDPLSIYRFGHEGEPENVEVQRLASILMLPRGARATNCHLVACRAAAFARDVPRDHNRRPAL